MDLATIDWRVAVRELVSRERQNLKSGGYTFDPEEPQAFARALERYRL